MTAVVHIVQRMAPGGIETLVLDLALADPTTKIISLEGRTSDLVERWPRLDLLAGRFVGFEKKDGLEPLLLLKIARFFRDWRAHAVIAHHIGPLLYGGLAARLVGIGMRIHVEHDGWHYDNPSRARLGKLLDLLVNPRKVAVSKVTANSARKALGHDLIEIIPNGVDLDRFRPGDKIAARRAFGLPGQARIVGTMGRLVHVKGHDILIDAAHELAPDIHIAIAGDGEELAALKARANDLGLAHRVHFLGQCDQPEALYPAFDMFCLPSRAEGFPRVLIEAQACNIPVVATSVGGVKEAVCPRTGILLEPENPTILARALQGMFDSAQTFAPREFVYPRFSLARTLAAYRSLTETPQMQAQYG